MKIPSKPYNLFAPIAVVGMSCRFPGANTVEEFWQLLAEGRDAITEVPLERWDAAASYDEAVGEKGKTNNRWGGFLQNVKDFDPRFFEISTREAAMIDPQQRLMLEVSWEALENGGINPQQLKETRGGVYVGVSGNEYAHEVLQVPADLDGYFATGNALCAIANRVSYFFGLTGPSLILDTGCSASLVALHLACQGLQTGEIDLALTGGVNLIFSPNGAIALSQSWIMAADGRCKPFDVTADGYTRSEGCGVVVLKRLEDAERDGNNILAIIRSSAVSHNGHGSGASMAAPDVIAQQKLITEALNRAGLKPSDISYIEAHGTGTPSGDAVEAQALAGVFGFDNAVEHSVWLGSVKGNIGHTEPVAGIAGLIKVILSLKHSTIPPQLNFTAYNPDTGLEKSTLVIPQQSYPWSRSSQPRRASVNSFGIGGTLAHLIVEEPPVVTAVELPKEQMQHTIILSARNEVALKELANKYLSFLAQQPDISLAQLAYTINTGRARFNYQVAVSGFNLTEIAENLRIFCDTEKLTPVSSQLEKYLPGKISSSFVFYKASGQSNPFQQIDDFYADLEGVSSVGFLPTYPFQRQRCWPSKTDKEEKTKKLVAPKSFPVNGTIQQPLANFDQWLYTIEWELQSQTSSGLELNLDQATWLIFNDSISLANQIVQELRKRGQNCIQVKSGPTFAQLDQTSYQVNPLSLLDFQQLISQVTSQMAVAMPLNVLYFGGVELRDKEVNKKLKLLQEQQYGSLLHLAQTLVQKIAESPIKFWIITRGSQAVLAKDGVSGLFQSPLWGLGRVVRAEHGEESEVHCLDLDPIDSDKDIDQLLGEFFNKNNREEMVAFRLGNHYIPLLTRTTFSKQPKSNFEVHQQAAYLITGGLGALGLTHLRWLIERGATYIVLTGRNAPNEGTQKKIRELTKTGVTIKIETVDVTNYEAMAQLIEGLPLPLRGVIHCSGVLDDGVLVSQTWTRFKKVLAPKVNGSWNLHLLTLNQRLDFFVLCSSVASVFGTAGQSSYVAANSFMDALAHYRRRQGLPALSVNWGPWAEAGMATNLNHQVYRRWKNQQVTFIKPEWGINILEQLLENQTVQTAVINLDWTGSRQVLAGMVNESSRFFSRVLAESLTPSSSNVQPIEELESYLRKTLAGWLDITENELNMDLPVNQLGIDSISLLELKHRLKMDFKIELNTRYLIEAPSLNQLIRRINSSQQTFPTEIRKTGWLVGFQPQSNAKVRLFCFHHLGGNASAYTNWHKLFGTDIDVCPVQLPGREERLNEPFITSFEKLIENLVDSLSPYLFDKPFAFYGHSMGALISLELASYLHKKQSLPTPNHLFLGALLPPHILETPFDFKKDNSYQLKRLLNHFTDDREAVLQDEEYSKVFSSIVEGDTQLFNSYFSYPSRFYHSQGKLSVPITTFGGANDEAISIEQLQEWRNCTDRVFDLQVIPNGNHLFIFSHKELLVKIIRQKLLPDGSR